MDSTTIQRRSVRSVLVLVSGDDLASSLQEALTGDLVVTCPDSPESALAAIEEQAVDVLIVDAGLPDGRAWSAAARFLEARPRGRALVLAGMNDPDTLLGLREHPDRLDVLFMPWNESELRSRLLCPCIEATR